MSRSLMWMLWLLAPLLQAAEPVGLLSMVSGDVQIIRAGESEPETARTADLLGAGDRVRTGAGSEATFLFCPESRTAKMPAGSEVQFDAESLIVSKGGLTEERRVLSCRLPASLVLAAASKMRTGSTRIRGDEIVMLRSPAEVLVPSLNPGFRWDPVKDATTYQIRVEDREERILWRTDVLGTEVQYPAEAEVLAWGQRYRWRVTALNEAESIGAGGSSFQVMPEEQAAMVRNAVAELEQQRAANPSDNGPLFLLAFLYEDNGMLDDALRVYGELTRVMGPQDWVRSRVEDLEGRLGWDRPGTRPSQ